MDNERQFFIIHFPFFRFPPSIMILAVDIGNSSIKFGVFDRENLVVRFTVPTGVDKIGTEDIFSIQR
jgi:hypothetical protein